MQRLETDIIAKDYDTSEFIARITLHKDFNPKTQAVILVDLEKDPQVWLEKTSQCFLHDTKPIYLEGEWVSADVSGCGEIVPTGEFKPDWIPVDQVAHMVCIGFLKPEEEQPKQEPEHKEPNGSMWNLPADWEVARETVKRKYPQAWCDDSAKFNKPAIFTDKLGMTHGRLALGETEGEAWTNAAKAMETEHISSILEKYWEHFLNKLSRNGINQEATFLISVPVYSEPKEGWISVDVCMG
jgi:hypothetical protein